MNIKNQITVTPIVLSTFRVDGGAMFGLIPKPIWSRMVEYNDLNSIPQNANCLLLELEDGRRGLVDTGCGNPQWFSEKQRDRQALDAQWLLTAALGANSLAPKDIDFVILSHLHWDHAGGIGRVNPEGSLDLTFPNAQIFIHADEWQDATSGDRTLGNAYPREIWEPLEAVRQDRLLLVTDMAPDILPGIRLARSGGHTRGHCAVVIQGNCIRINHPEANTIGTVESVVYAGDVCPTRTHLRLLYETSFDMFPLQTRQWKLNYLPEIARDRSLLCFCHDPKLWAVTITPDEKVEYQVSQSLNVPG